MKKILLSSLAILMSCSMFAQRTIDLSVDSFIAPTTMIQGSTSTGTQFLIHAVIKNNSTMDTVKVGDTLTYQSSLSVPGGIVRSPVFARLITKNINPGDTQHFYTLFSWNQYLINSTRVTVNLNVQLSNRPELAADINANNVHSVEMDYINPNGFGVSVNNLDASSVSLYPNPANSTINISIPKVQVNADIEVTVSDLTGKAILTKTFTSVEEMKMDVSTLENGIYVMSVENGENTYSSKVTVSK